MKPTSAQFFDSDSLHRVTEHIQNVDASRAHWISLETSPADSFVLHPGSSHFHPLCCSHALEAYAKYVTGHFIVFPVASPPLMAEIGV